MSIAFIAKAEVNIGKFNDVVEQVKELKKNDLVGALKLLTPYEKSINNLTIEQSLLYYTLLTEIQIEQNQYSIAKETATQGLAITKNLASPSILISELLYLKGFAFENLSDIAAAADAYKKGLEVAESLHHKVQLASGLINLGGIAYLTGDYERSLVLLNDAYNISGQTNNEKLKGKANSELGILYSQLQQEDQSMIYYQQSYKHFKKAGLILEAHNSLQNIAVMHIYNKNYQQAISVFKTIITDSNTDSPSDSMYSVYSGLAWAYLKKEQSNPNLAHKYLLMAKPYMYESEKLDNQLDFYFAFSFVLERLNRSEEALKSIKRLEEIMNRNQELTQHKKKNYVDALGLRADIFYQQKKYRQAYQAKSKQIIFTDKLYQNEDNRSIAQVRFKFEAEQADKENKILHNQQKLFEENLREAKLQNEEQRFYLLISALVTLAFAWILVKLLQSQYKFKIASNVDSLTGIKNRHSLMQNAQVAFKVAKEKDEDFSVLMVDIDNFRELNDRLGRITGDIVVSRVAALGAAMMRKSDIMGRFGGEEFMVCLPKTSLKSAMIIGERIRSCVSMHKWDIDKLEKVRVSVGVATSADGMDLLQLIKCADEQLHLAKSSGKNKVFGL